MTHDAVKGKLHIPKLIGMQARAEHLPQSCRCLSPVEKEISPVQAEGDARMRVWILDLFWDRQCEVVQVRVNAEPGLVLV